MSLQIQATATPLELLANDSRLPENRILDHPVWQEALSGEMPKSRLKKLLLNFYPALAGGGRFAFAAKVSHLTPADGKELFMQLYDSLKNPAADADEGWKKVLRALGASEAECQQALAHPLAEAEDLVEVIRGHGLRSSAVEASVIAHMLERHLPELWSQLADSLKKNYGVKAEALAYLRYEADRGDKVKKWIKRLVDTYVVPAGPLEVFEGRRAGREAVWAWTVLTETV
jgi:hypothetical protein